MASIVTVTLNGEHREVRGGISVTDLILELELEPQQVAVELNRALVRRSLHANTLVRGGDVLEVVTLVGGG